MSANIYNIHLYKRKAKPSAKPIETIYRIKKKHILRLSNKIAIIFLNGNYLLK